VNIIKKDDKNTHINSTSAKDVEVSPISKKENYNNT